MKDLEHIDLNLLLLLHWLLIERSVTKAGERVGISQPAASRALGRLRAVFNDELFVQSGRVLIPTKLATYVAQDVAKSIRHMRRVLKHEIRFEPGSFEGTVSIACNDYLSTITGHLWVNDISPFAPNLTTSWRPLTAQSVESLISGRLDFVIAPEAARASFPRVSAIDDMVVQPFLTDQFVLFGSRMNPVFNLKSFNAETMAGLDHVLVSPSGRGSGLVDEKLSEDGLSRKIRYRTWSFLQAAEIALTSNCVVVLPKRLAKMRANGAFRSLPIKVPPIESFLAWHSNRRNDPMHKWMRLQLLGK